MVTLFTAANINFLADELNNRVDYKRELSSFFKQQPSIIVQNAGMEQWIKLELAKRKGAFAEVDISLPAAKLFDLQKKILDVDDIPRSNRWFISRQIARILAEYKDHPSMESASKMWRDADQNRYVQERKRWVLAEQIADAFDEYELYRARDIDNWSVQADDWQKFIMNKLYNKEDLFRYSAALKSIENVEQAKPYLNSEYHVFALPGLIPNQIEMLNAVSRYRPVYFYVVYPFSNREEQDFRLNNYLGRQVVDYVELIKKICDPDCVELDQSLNKQQTQFNFRDKPVSDLELLKSKISGDNVSLNSECKVQSAVHVASVHNALREVEVLHDWLCQLSLEDESLKSDDILIVSPQMDTYQPYLEAVFNNADRIYPRSFDLSFGSNRGSKFDAVLAVQYFIEILKNRCTTTEILELLDFKSVRETLDIQDNNIDLIRRWLEESGIRWGLSAGHKGKWNLPETKENTWDFGLKRLMLGMATGEMKDLYRDILPLNEVQQVEDAELLGKLRFLIRIISQASAETESRKTMIEWVEWLRSITTDVIGEESASLVFSSAQKTLEKTEAIMEPEEIPYEVFSSFIRKLLKRSSSGGGRQRGTVLCADMVPMRSLPYRVIAILGLNDGAFPRAELRPAFSYLTTHENRPGDRSRKADDRLLLLEYLLSAQDKLYLSYQGRNQYTNEEVPPSAVLSQLITELETVRRQHGIQPISPVRKYPLQAHSSQYIPYGEKRDEKNPWKEESIPTTAFGRFNTVTSQNFWEGLFEAKVPKNEHTLNLDWKSAIQRLIDPVQMFTREQLGIYVREFDLFDKEDESFALNGLENYQLLSRFLDGRYERSHLREDFLQASGISPSRQQSKTIIRDLDYKLMIFDQLEQELDVPDEEKEFSVSLQLSGVKLTGSVKLRGGWLVRKSASKHTYKRQLSDALTSLIFTHILGSDFKGVVTIARDDTSKKKIKIHSRPAFEVSYAETQMKFIKELLNRSLRKALPFNELVAEQAWNSKEQMYNKPATIFKKVKEDFNFENFDAMYLTQEIIEEWLMEDAGGDVNGDINFKKIEQTFRAYMNGGLDE